MGLPKIAHYELPAAHELPVARVPWTPDRDRAALLVHDMQRYFVGAYAPDADQIARVTANVAALARRCRAAGVPVVYTAQKGDQDPRDRGLQRFFWGPGMSSAPEHQPIVDALAPEPGDVVLEKWRYSAFQRTNLATILRARGRDQLLVTGIYASIGCLLSAADAFMHDVEPFFVADAVADFSRAQHDLAVTWAAERCAVPVVTAQLLEALS